MYLVEERNLAFSIALHALVMLVAFVGLPILLPSKPDPQPLVISVEMLPIGAITNVKPSDKPIQKEQNAPKLKKTKEPPPPKPPEKTLEKVVEKKAPEPEAEPIKKDETKPKEEPKKEVKKEVDDFEKMMADLRKTEKAKPKDATPVMKEGTDKTNAVENKTKSDAPYDASLPLSLSEKDAIKGQFVQCWNVPIGAKNAESLAVRIKIQLLPDGTVKAAEVAPDQKGRYGTDTFFRAAADSALRAVHKCSPLKNLPPDKYGSWGSMELNFDPSEML